MNAERALEIAKAMKVEADCKAKHIKNDTYPFCRSCKKKSCILKQPNLGEEAITYSAFIIGLIRKDIKNAKG